MSDLESDSGSATNNEFDELGEDRDKLEPKTLGLTKSYVPGWRARDEIREYYQNWLVYNRS